MSFSQRVSRSLFPPLYLVAFIWVIFLFTWFVPGQWGAWGIYPRALDGLPGVLFAPLLHGDWGHIISNTPPLFALTAMLLLFYPRVAWPVFVMIYLLTGLTVWAFGRPVYHIGASGVVYGLVAFLAWNGIFRRNIKAIAIALLVVFYYGSMFVGILPNQEGISWESHLLGAVVGIFTAFWFRDQLETDEHRERPSWEMEPEDTKPFLPPDAFEKTKAQRRQEQRQDHTLW